MKTKRFSPDIPARTPAVKLILFFFIPLSVGALDVPSAQIQDDSSLRLSLVRSWFQEAPGQALSNRPFIHTLPNGERIQVRSEAERNEFMIILAREYNGGFPGWAQGSWILVRNREDGAQLRIRVFLRSDPYTYVQFRPLDGGRCLMDVAIYDGYIVHSQPVPVPFERLFVMPLEEVLRASGSRFPRRYFDPQRDDYRDLRTFITAVRRKLPTLSYRDDGAIDERGRYVFIDSGETQEGTPGLNCSGFAKWVIDGILRPLTGKLLPIAPLKAAFGERGSSFTEIYESQQDPFFGLDWTRNLASRANAVLRGSALGELQEIEVQDARFASVITRSREGSAVRSYPGYLSQAGFGIEGLHPLLYTLAIDEPGRVYLASVNTELGAPESAANLRGGPWMRRHFHVAVLAPFFDENGDFQVVVFESAQETAFAQFKARYPNHYVNLARVPVEGAFDPELPTESTPGNYREYPAGIYTLAR
ncbi:MAG: hypothetical protein LBG76_11205 [Treponema sp.]|nr:hypothetical protein [Treponema sp.]